MGTFFFLCAIVGGTIMSCQFVLTLIGIGGTESDFDVDIPDDVDVEFGDAADGADFSDDADALHHGSTWLFGVVSFRTVVAALTFFGLFGLAAESAGATLLMQLLAGLIGGGVAMYAVHWVMTTFKRLGTDGTIRISRAVGQTGTVYIPIPGGKKSAGKIQVKVQERLVEYAAMTSVDEDLSTGAKVVVVGVIGQNTLEVEPLHETANATDA